MATLPTTNWLRSSTKGEVAKNMRNYLAEVLPAGPSEMVEASYKEWPSNLGGEFPLQITEFVRARGINRRTRDMPEEMTFNLFFYELAIPDPLDDRDGAQRAKDITIDIFDEFTRLLDESGFKEKVVEYLFDPWESGPLLGPQGQRVSLRGADIYGLHAVLRVTL